MNFLFEIIEKDNITDSHRDIFASMLKAQGKVMGDMNTKADRCKAICFCHYNGKVAAVGALKQKTASDFSVKKAGLNLLNSSFEWELGYIYTASEFRGKGLARSVVAILLESFGDGNLMASTEISKNPAMVSILESNNFRLYGKPWKSDLHGNYLGLFLRFK
ncbi:hypothetical protein PCO87_02475 [Pectobacteriaceae bacterium C52]|nr:hypothetical protein PCO87_02475 [Pectobacteriaceae bacterium C52]